MLYTIINIKAYNEFLNTTSVEKIYTCTKLDTSDQESLTVAYRYYSQNTKENFTLGLYIKEPLSSSALPGLIAFFFLPGLININGYKLCTLIGPQQEILENAKSNIVQFASTQGIEKIIINCIKLTDEQLPSIIDNKENASIFNSPEELLKSYTSAIESYHIEEFLFYLQNTSLNNEQLFSEITTIETKVKTKKPELYNALEQTKKLNANYHLLEIKNLALSKELQHYIEHNETIRSTHEAKELQEYYNSQYEALPSWYKKIGNLIKMIMGKKEIPLSSNNQQKKKAH